MRNGDLLASRKAATIRAAGMRLETEAPANAEPFEPGSIDRGYASLEWIARGLQTDIDQINKRYDSLSAERDILQAAVNARTLTGEDITAALQFCDDAIVGL